MLAVLKPGPEEGSDNAKMLVGNDTDDPATCGRSDNTNLRISKFMDI